MENLTREEFLKSHNRENFDFHNSLVNARAAGFKSGNDFKDLEDYWEFQDQKEKNRIKFLEDKTSLLFEYGYSISNWNGLAISAGHNGFNSTDNIIENMRNYLEYLKKKEEEQQIFQDKKNSLLIQYEKDPDLWKYILIAAHRHKFNTNDDFEDVRMYLEYLNNGNFDVNHKDPASKLVGVNQEHKNLCKKFGQMYKNEISWRNYLVQSNKLGLSIEDYLKELQKIDENKNNDIMLLQKYNIVIEKKTLSKYRNLAKRNNLTLQQYLEKIYKKEIEKQDIIRNFNLNSKDFYRKLAAARNSGIRTNDEIQDVKDYLENLNREKIEKEELINKKSQFMLDHQLLPENWTNNLVCARAAGFKSYDPFEDLTKWFEYRKSVEENKIPEIFYKSKTRDWINRKISGIYCWLINDTPFYIGKSTNILNRSYDHMYNICNFPEFWCNIYAHLNDTKLDRELYWIDKLKPISQKCDGTDNVVPLIDR